MFSSFRFGINLDNPWTYARLPQPKSIIFPHLISLGLPESRVLDDIDEFIIKIHKDKEPKSEAAASAALADMLSDLKVDFVRSWFPWNFFEREIFDFKELKRMLDTSYSEYPLDTMVDALSSKGIKVIPVIACGYQRMLPRGLSPDSSPTDFIQRAYVHARLLVRHYKKFTHAWQIENEPNWWKMHSAAGWRSGAIWFEQGFRDELLAMLNQAVHEEDTDSMTIINLEADQEDIKVTDYAKYCDVIGLDFYPNYKLAYPVNVSSFSKAEAIYRSAGKDIIISETGYPSGPSLLGYNQLRQEEYIKAACLSAIAQDHIGAIAIWRYMDPAWRSFPEQENYFGLLDNYGKPKRAWRAYSDFIHINK